MPNDGGGLTKKGAPSASGLKSPVKTAPGCTGGKRKGYWLGRKAILKTGEAPRRIKAKNATRGDNKSSVESKTTREHRVKTSSSRGNLGQGGGSNLGPELERADLHRNPSN